jgi:hypothetical protein
MSKKLKTFIFLLFLSGLSFLGAIITFVDSSNLNLKKTKVIVGQVREAGITQRLVRGIKIKRPQTVFWFRLYNSSENFAIHLPNGGYSILEKGVRQGDTIKLYYRPSSSQFNLNVFQVESKSQILYDYREYKERSTNSAGYMVIGGVMILVIAFVGYTKFNIFTFLMRLTKVML